jgi:hypothetical protein
VSFSHRRCQTTISSVERLEALTRSRFAHRIQTLEIYTLFKCRSPDSLRYGLVQTTGAPCIVPELSYDMAWKAFRDIFQRTVNLKSITLRAPPELPGMRDILRYNISPTTGPLTLTVQDVGFYNMWETEHFPEHIHVIRVLSISRLMQVLIGTIRSASRQLEEFNVIGFADSHWQSKLLNSTEFFAEATILRPLRGLTSLTLQLEMATSVSGALMTSLVDIIKHNANLQALALSVGRKSIERYQSRSENWAPLLQLLGGSPPFHLRSLQIDGLVTSTTAPTLARIIAIHASTIRRVVLENTNFHYPNTLRAFFTACAHSTIRYYKTKNFYFHERTMIVGSALSYEDLEDEDERLHEDVENWDNDINHCAIDDASSEGWVNVNWKRLMYPGGPTMIFDDEDGRKGSTYMYNVFMNGVSLINDGGLIDS